MPKINAATATWIATSGHSGTRVAIQKGIAPRAMRALSQFGMIRLRQSIAAAATRPQASRTSNKKAVPPVMVNSL